MLGRHSDDGARTLIDSYATELDSITDVQERILDAIGSARLVLLGEASHGTHEFYLHRAEITRWLIQERGFDAVAAEADWPDAYRTGSFVQGRGTDRSADEALAGFKRFPSWMWRNRVVEEFVRWLRDRNRISAQPASFYGLDLYSLQRSMEAVVTHLERVDPQAADRARSRYACFERFGEDAQAYGYQTAYGLADPCEDEVVTQLTELQNRQPTGDDDESAFFVEQNARVVKGAEEYYREMYRGTKDTWNLRDEHMFDTLNRLDQFITRQRGRPARIAVWAHNSHLGDARATSMSKRGELNVGQLVRQAYGEEAYLLGFTTYTGTVTAASNWGSPPERKQVRPALPGSYEHLFHDSKRASFFLDLRPEPMRSALVEQRLERAIGVIYLPGTERISHYFSASLSRQFDGVIHLDQTTALEPLEPFAQTPEMELPDTYPTAV